MKMAPHRHSKEGHEILDPKPMQPPLGYKKAPSLSEQIRQQVLAAKLAELDHLEETEEEADDFEIDDELGPYSPHENEGMPTIKELKARVEEINAEIKRQNIEKIREEFRARAERAPGAVSPPPQSSVSSSGPAERPLDDGPKT